MKFEDLAQELRQEPEYVAAEEELRPQLELANDVLRLRLAKGWSQTELARRVNTKQANISRLENGLANPTVGFLRKVGRALGVDLVVRFTPEKTIEKQSTVVYVSSAIEPETLWATDPVNLQSPTRWIEMFSDEQQFHNTDRYVAA